MEPKPEQKLEGKPSLLRRGITKVTSTFHLVNKKLLLLLLGLLLIMLAQLTDRYVDLTRQPNQYLTPNYTSNVLLVYGAQLDNYVAPTALTLRFNAPVDVHEVSHYVSITPQIPGKWVASETDKTEIQYKFNKKFRGTFVTVHILQGLTSPSNKTLLSDFETYFPITDDREYEPYSRVKSYPVGEAIPLTYAADRINIYKSNAYTLLSFLQYSLPADEPRGSIYDGKYTQTDIVHQERDKVQNLKIDEDNNTITLDPGVYYVEGKMDVEPYFIVVSNFGALVRQDDKKVVMGAFDMKTGKKITDNVTFGLYNLTNGVNLLRDFVYSEENNSVALSYPTRLDAVIGIHKNDVVFIPVELPSSLADIEVSSNLDTDTEIFVYTDRPIYKPGDKVFVRGIIRQDADGLYKPPAAGRTIHLAMYNSGADDITQTTTLDEYGTFYTYFTVPDDVESAYSYIRVSLQPFSSNNYSYNTASFEVVKYVKPEFEIKTAVDKDEYLRSEALKFKISGNYFNGKPLENKEISYTLYTDNYYEVEKAVYNKNFNISSPGGMCGGGWAEDYFGTDYQSGTITLNDKGEAVIETKSDEKSLLSQKITLVAKITDKNNNELVSAANTIVHAAEFNIFFIPSAESYVRGDEAVIPFYAESLNGDKVRGKEFSYKLIDYQYNNDDSNKQTVIASGKTTSDDNGKGIIKFTIPKDQKSGGRQLIVEAKDGKDNSAQNQKSLYVLEEPEKKPIYGPRWGNRISQTFLKISSNQNTFKVNDTVQLTVDSPKDIDVLFSLERGRIYSPRFIHLNKGSNTVRFQITEDLSPSITAVFSYFTDGGYFTEGLSLNVPAMHKLLQIGLTPNKKVYSPTETAELHITTKDADGNPVAAQLSVGIVDKAIYALRESATPALHSSFYYFRPRRTNASSSLTGMGDWGGFGGGGGGGGAGSPGGAADVLYWNPNLRTDATGDVTIPVPLLGYKTIWKVNVMGSTITSQFGQADTEFTVTADVKGAKTKSSPPKK